MGHYGAPCQPPQVDPALLPSQAPAQPHQRRVRRFSAEPHRGAAAAAGLNGWAVIKEEKVPWGLYRWAFFDGYDDLQKYLLSMAIFYGENDD